MQASLRMVLSHRSLGAHNSSSRLRILGGDGGLESQAENHKKKKKKKKKTKKKKKKQKKKKKNQKEFESRESLRKGRNYVSCFLFFIDFGSKITRK